MDAPSATPLITSLSTSDRVIWKFSVCCCVALWFDLHFYGSLLCARLFSKCRPRVVLVLTNTEDSTAVLGVMYLK